MAVIAFLDFEASGLGPGSYPVEVAYALADDETLEPGATGSWLICPTTDWTAHGWDPVAECLHGLSRDLLEREGHSAWAVADALNRALGDAAAVFTDAPLIDSNWLAVLFEEFPDRCAFGLRDLAALLRLELSGLEPDRARDVLREARAAAGRDHPAVHRALPDALRMRDTWLRAARTVRDAAPGEAPGRAP